MDERNQSARRVLVVDDHPDTVAIFTVFFRGLGCESRCELRGRDVLRTARVFDPELITVDIGLPDINGYEVVHALRADPRLANRFIVAVTGWARPQDVRHALAAGFDEHLVKPVDSANLRRIARLARARAESVDAKSTNDDDTSMRRLS